MADLRERLRIDSRELGAINDLLTDPNNRAVSAILDVVAKYGTPDEINRKAREARKLENLLGRLKKMDSPYLADVEWLIEQRDSGAFITVTQYRKKVLGDRAVGMKFKDDFAVTLEISAAQYFPWIRLEAEQSIANGELMPARFIRVRKMKEQEKDDGDIVAFAAAMQVMGASYVETLDTKGTDGSNVHLGGPATITGYFGGIGEPNDYALKWIDEYLYYYTNYGVRQVLNTNPGTVLLSYIIYKLGIDNEFKISVFMGNDNPYAALWTLIGAKMFSRPDGTTPLVGFNWSNSINNETMEITAELRKALGFENEIRFEHHITEAYRSIVRQPYDRRAELVAVADHVKNISAKHEGGDVKTEMEIEAQGGHCSDILDYFRDKSEIIASGDWDAVTRNYLDKHAAVNNTARALTEHGLSFLAAPNLHHR
ncbi:MAG: hypothetical protein NUV93_00225 [Firmicutes bacterium]|jgi:hypothetical protein|nr:hypothetical protein [Bacillota bacterium]